MNERFEVQRTIPAEASTIFDVVSSPKGHVAIDASGMLQSSSGEPAHALGDTFVVHMDREALGPTGVGRGVAIPHARLAGVPNVIGLFVRLEKPVDFESIDRQPVDLVFALFAPEAAGADHLKALARVSRTLRSEAVCAKLRSTFDPSALYAILTDGKAEQAA